ncbi:MAG TPA: hypothetical protein PKW95_19345 [bacterium]|nr:hypothetical protein [bacterium]
MRATILLLLAVMIAALAVAVIACSEDDDDDEDQVDCRTPLTIFYNECHFAITFNDVDTVAFDEALASCAFGSGKMWNMFIHCYRTGYLANDDDCAAWADCLPDHGFVTGDDDDDTTDDDTVDDDTADDDTADDDTTDDDTADDDTTDDDTTDDDTTDDDTTDDDTTDDDTID